MDIDVKSKSVNHLLSRDEVLCEVVYTKEPTPSRKAIREALAKQLGAKENLVIINYIKTLYGEQKAVVRANVYKKEEDCKSLEKRHLLVRAGLMEAKKKGGAKVGKEEEGAEDKGKEAEKEEASK